MSRLKVLLGVAISVVLVVVLLRNVDRRALVAQLAGARWDWVLVSTLLAPLGLLARAQRWRHLFPPRSDPPPLVPPMMIGYMANNVLPLRAGELVRVYLVARRWGHGFWTVLATLVVERVLDSLSLVAILAILVLAVPVPRAFQVAAGVLLAIDVVGVAAMAVFATRPDVGRRLVARIGRRWPAVERRIAPMYDTFIRGLDGIRTPSHLVPALAWNVIVWLIPALAAWTMLLAIGLDLPLTAGFTVLAFVGIGVSVPSAPGYVGVFHFAATKSLEVFGVGRDAALGYAILFHAAQYVPITLIGWLYLLREHVALGDATRYRATSDGEIV